MLICAVIATQTYHTSLNIVKAVIAAAAAAAAAAAFIVRSLVCSRRRFRGVISGGTNRLRASNLVFRIHSEYATAPYTWQATWWD